MGEMGEMEEHLPSYAQANADPEPPSSHEPWTLADYHSRRNPAASSMKLSLPRTEYSTVGLEILRRDLDHDNWPGGPASCC